MTSKFEKQAQTRSIGIPLPNWDAYKDLISSIRADEAFSTMQRRSVLWMIETSGLSTSMISCFYHREWGAALGLEIQLGADHIGNKYRNKFLACGKGFHLNHHCGGLDEAGHYSSRFRANTLWVVDGDEHYPDHLRDKKGRKRAGLMQVTPSLAEIGAINLRLDS
jgi:hypothetical protein